MKFHFKIKKEKRGFSAICIELPGCVTQGDDSDEIHKNMVEALNLYVDEPSDSRTLFPMPRQRLKGRNIVEVALEPRIAFAFALRMTRLKAKLTQREVAEKLVFRVIEQLPAVGELKYG